MFICSDSIELNGGARGSRTPDLLNAIQALSQLSYGPGFRNQKSEIKDQETEFAADT
jgi:hypothetical protein